MPVKPAVVQTTVALQDDTEQLHSDVRKLMQELFPEEWGALNADHIEVRRSARRLTPANTTQDDPELS